MLQVHKKGLARQNYTLKTLAEKKEHNNNYFYFSTICAVANGNK